MEQVMSDHDETEDEPTLLTPEMEAQMIWSDYPVIRSFECPLVGCDAVIDVHGDVDLILVLTPEEAEAGKVADTLRIAFVPKVFPDGMEQHLALDHGASTDLRQITADEFDSMQAGEFEEDDD